MTFNYRLGPFGFLSINHPDYSGNMGLKDQRMAMRWVNRNIERFGGDRSQITIFGHGAGNVPMWRRVWRKILIARKSPVVQKVSWILVVPRNICNTGWLVNRPKNYVRFSRDPPLFANFSSKTYNIFLQIYFCSTSRKFLITKMHNDICHMYKTEREDKFN